MCACAQASLLAEATAFRDANIVDVASYAELRDAIAAGKWARGWWAGAALKPCHNLAMLPAMSAACSRMCYLQVFQHACPASIVLRNILGDDAWFGRARKRRGGDAD